MNRNLLIVAILLSTVLLFSACVAQLPNATEEPAQNNLQDEESLSSNTSIETTTPENKSSASAPVKDLTSSVPTTKTYTFLHDCWNLYIATFLSDNVIKIERWYRFNAGKDADPFSHRSDLSVVKTDDPSFDFQWLDSNYSSFFVTLCDEENSHWREPCIVGFAENDNPTDPSIPSGKPTYSFRNDEWNQYIATVLSDETIKIEKWDRSNSGYNGDPFMPDYDVCILQITDPQVDFKWLDDNHSAFSITMIDNENSHWKELLSVDFSMNNVPTESNANEEQTVYTYQSDDWHLYVAIPLSLNIIKIETWYRSDASENGEPFYYRYDVTEINTNQADVFSWIDESSRNGFTVNIQDPKNSHWNEVNPVSFAICPNFAELYLLPLQAPETTSPEP